MTEQVVAAVEPAVHAPKSEAHATTVMADALVAAGHMTRERADELVRLDLNSAETGVDSEPSSVTPADPLKTVVLDPVFDRPASPMDYKFPPAMSDVPLPELQGFQELAFAARMPAPIANAIFSVADEHAAKPMPLADAELMGAKTLAALEKRYGVEGAQAKLALGKRFIKEMAVVDPRVQNLANGRAGVDLRFVSHIIEHAERLYGARA